VYQNKDHTSQKHIVTKSNYIDISDQKNLLEVSKKISNLISKNDNFFLYGDIGVGKTTFTRFLINNLQTKNNINTSEVLSPTFNILHEYKIKNINIKHFDLYRIKQKEELDNLGLFEENEAINIIEWPEILKSMKLKKIEFYFSYSNEFKNRNLIITANYNNKITDEFK
tara:strand:+ start:14 stop:520 length:507 start_codon:yes stop_codon:yes gene_type:complete